jgi:hypothetical protein
MDSVRNFREKKKKPMVRQANGKTSRKTRTICRAARWFVFVPIWVKFWRTLEWKMLIYFMSIRNILGPFCTIYGRLVQIVYGHLVYFSRFGIFGLIKILQP